MAAPEKCSGLRSNAPGAALPVEIGKRQLSDSVFEIRKHLPLGNYRMRRRRPIQPQFAAQQQDDLTSGMGSSTPALMLVELTDPSR
jgi:hypothetical protein